MSLCSTKKVSKATLARQAGECTKIMCRAWGAGWEKNLRARQVHTGLCRAAAEHSHSLVGKGLSKWSAAALKHVASQQLRNLVDVRRVTGAPPNTFGIAPGIPEAGPQKAVEKAAAGAKNAAIIGRIKKMAHGKGANSRDILGMPHNIDNFRRARVERTGAALVSSGAPGDDTFPDRAMKSGQELDSEFPVDEPVDVIFNYGGNDAPVEDITNYGQRPTRGGLRLFKK